MQTNGFRVANQPLSTVNILGGLLALVGIATPFMVAAATKHHVMGACNCDDYDRGKRAIDEADERIREGGGLGNQDEDLLKGLKDALEVAKDSKEITQVVDNIVEEAANLGFSTETLIP